MPRISPNLLGTKIHRLTVIRKLDSYISPNGHKTGRWECICECGNHTISETTQLTRGIKKSCGCLRAEWGESTYINLVNKKFGKLLVIEKCNPQDFPEKKKYSSDALWRCKCDCGNMTIVNSASLKSGGTRSCGCLNQSWIAQQLKKYFSEKYYGISEYKCVKNPKTNYYLPYDIYIPNGIFIEIQGDQHYKFIKWFHKTRKTFNERKCLDKIKKKFAEENGIYIEVDLRKIKTVEQAINYIEKRL